MVHEDHEAGGYWAEVVDLPGCFAAGDTLDELEQDVRGAIETYIAAQEKLGKPVPKGRNIDAPDLRRWEIAIA
ncbi:MAG: type II toxin-antitoxin system HicB family antitoxin [Luteitalea sp.]|nr:type II toxin-antitoxin system HicB family antitoxin [Luteitalea sp.]